MSSPMTRAADPAHAPDAAVPFAVSNRRPFGLARHSLALARRSVIKTLRTPEQLLDVTLQPIVFVLIFVYLLGGAVSGSTHDYLQHLLPAITVQSVLFAGMATGVTLNTDIKEGVFDRLRSLPIGRSAPLLGSMLGDLVRYAVAIVTLLAFGHLLGFRAHAGPLSVLAASLLIMLFVFCVSWVFVLAGVTMREPGGVQGTAFLILFPLTFATNMIAPEETMPGWLQAWIDVNPVAHLMDASRGLMVGGPVAEPALWSLAWAAGFLAVFAPLAVTAYRRRT